MADERRRRRRVGERAGARLGEAAIVDEPGALERLERALALGFREPARREALVDLVHAPVAVAQRAQRALERVAPVIARPVAQLSTGTASSTSTSTSTVDRLLRRRPGREEPRRDDLVLRGLGLDAGEDLLDEIGVLA